MSKESPKKAREAAGLTPIEVAAGVPCSLSVVYKSEKRGSYPETPETLRIAYRKFLRDAIDARRAARACREAAPAAKPGTLPK